MFEYKPHFIPSAIYVVGCGGTGSRLVPLIAQLVKTTLRSKNPLGWIENLPIFLIDDDVIEPKNLTRQNFVEQDVGQKKSIVLASRYGRGFDVQIFPSTQRLNKETESLEFIGYSNSGNIRNNIILVMAVDSAEARREVLGFAKHSFTNVFVIDAGNEDDFGQVRFFTDTRLVCGSRNSTNLPQKSSKDYLESEKITFLKKFPKMISSSLPVDYIPYPEKYYEELGSSASEKSCADLDQTLSINAMMATLMCGIIQNFLYIKPMNYHGISYNLNGSVGTSLNTLESWFNYTIPASFSLKPIKQMFGNSPEGESNRYYKHVVLELDKKGLMVNYETGEVTLKSVVIPEVQEVIPVKKSRKSPVKLSVLMEEDIAF